MFATFFHELKAAKVPVTLKEYLTLMEALRGRPRRPQRRALLLSLARRAGEGRAPPRQVRPGVRPRLQGPRTDARGAGGADPRGVAALGRPALPVRGGEGQDRGARRLGKDHGGAEEAPRGAEGPPPGRQQVDRHRRHVALRRRRLQPRRRAHRPEDQPQQPRHQGVGQARVQGPRRQRSSSAPATSRSRYAACASSPARARPTSSTSTAPSRAPRTRATSTSTCGPSGATPSRC